MNRPVSSSLAALAAAAVLAAPALGEPVRKTELGDASGQPVDSLRLSYNFDAVWVVDNQNLLWRDESRDYYLVILNGACEQLDSRGRRFNFHPADPVRLDATRRMKFVPRRVRTVPSRR